MKNKKWTQLTGFLKRYRVPLALVALAILGLLFQILLHEYAKKYWLEWAFTLADELTKAFIIAVFLGVIVDVAIKMELARDVFEAAIGYLLPPELRPSLKWIYDQ